MAYEQFLAGRVRALCRAQEAAQAGTVDELDAFEVDEKLSDIARLEGHQFALKLRCGDQVKLACKRELSASTHPGGLDPQFTPPWSPAPVEWLVHRPDYRATRGCFRRGRSRAAARFSTA